MEISRAKKNRKWFFILAVLCTALGLLLIPTIILAIIVLLIALFMFMVWSGINRKIKDAEAKGLDFIDIESAPQNKNNEPEIETYNAPVSVRKRNNKHERKTFSINTINTISYKPILELCAEIENNNEDNYTPFNPSIPVEIIYCDEEGNVTNRKIDVIHIKSGYNDAYYIRAFCYLRNEERTFKVERIQKTTVDGNEVDFIQYIVDTYRNTNKYKETIQHIKTRDLLNSTGLIGTAAKILTYISRIDGVFTKKEKTAIAFFLKELDVEQSDIEVEDYVTGLADLEVSTTQYKKIVKSISISENLIEKAKEIAGKDPLRLGAFEILAKQSKVE